mmetsp:Transcript_5786/g.18842  ORF Transcript_5786/g.18842 Transcript_5786/m.18842 type:complete len:378 (-) Transcript_5786:1056-2189(-)
MPADARTILVQSAQSSKGGVPAAVRAARVLSTASSRRCSCRVMGTWVDGSVVASWQMRVRNTRASRLRWADLARLTTRAPLTSPKRRASRSRVVAAAAAPDSESNLSARVQTRSTGADRASDLTWPMSVEMWARDAARRDRSTQMTMIASVERKSGASCAFGRRRSSSTQVRRMRRTWSKTDVGLRRRKVGCDDDRPRRGTVRGEVDAVAVTVESARMPEPAPCVGMYRGLPVSEWSLRADRGRRGDDEGDPGAPRRPGLPGATKSDDRRASEATFSCTPGGARASWLDSSLSDVEVSSDAAPPEKEEKLTEVRRDRAVEKAETYDSSSTGSRLKANSARTMRSVADAPPPATGGADPSPTPPSASSGSASTSFLLL